MSIPMNRTAVILLASGLSRRYGWRDKMLENLGGKPLMEHAAGPVAGLDALARIAVCPADRKEIAERLNNRFIIAVNKQPKSGLGHSIALGVDVAMKFKPDAVLLCMADMPFIEPWMLDGLISRLGPSGADIVHSGDLEGVRPPTAFGPACFKSLLELDGDDGAKRIIGQGSFSVIGTSIPAPLLADVDTKEDLELARQQFAIRQQHVQNGPVNGGPANGQAAQR
jgi:molybdenum cofactor cytidylyltransferase